MTYEGEKAARGKRARVLFTGYGVRMIENLMDHLTGRYELERCQGRDFDLESALERFKPHVLIICLQNEFVEDLRAYHVLESEPQFMNIPVLVIGRDEDCSQFKKGVVLQNETILGRPLNIDVFLPTLDKLADGVLAAEAAAAPPTQNPEPKENGGGLNLDDLNLNMGIESDQMKKLEKQIAYMTRLEGRKSILVVDDDVRMLNIIKLFLQELYDVTVVPSGKLALKFLSKKHADLVLLDYLMPEMDGPQVLAQIRTSAPEPEVPVIFLTGVADKELVLKILELGPNGYLLKPVTREVLLERVTEVLLGL